MECSHIRTYTWSSFFETIIAVAVETYIVLREVFERGNKKERMEEKEWAEGRKGV